MADEAVVRIVLQDGSTTGTGAGAGAAPSSAGSSPRPATTPSTAPPRPVGGPRPTSLLGTLNMLRGTIGGIFGPAGGAALDMVSLMSRAAAPVGGAGVAGAGAAGVAGATAAGAGVALVAVGIAAAAVVKSFELLNKEAKLLSDRLGPYSVPISFAQAQAEMRHELLEFRRAQTAGPNLAQFVTASSRFNENIEDIKVQLTNNLLPVLNNLLSMANNFIEKIGTKNIADGVTGGIAGLLPPLLQQQFLLQVIAGRIAQLQEQNASFDLNPLMEIIPPGV